MSQQTVFYVCAIFGLLASGVLVVFLIVNLIRKITGRAVLIAATSSFCFIAAFAYWGYHPNTLSLELVALLTWNILLARILGIGWRGNVSGDLTFVWRILIGLVVGTLSLIAYLQLARMQGPNSLNDQVNIIHSLVACGYLAGLVLLEQVSRNTRESQHWRNRYLYIAIGTLFSYGTLVHFSAILSVSSLSTLAALHPVIISASCPLVAISAVRNSQNSLNVNLSRRFVFRSGVLLVIGLLLFILVTLGYYLRLLEGNWGLALTALIATILAISTAIVFGSGKIRRYLKVVISKSLYEYKYDYRDEWLRVTGLLSDRSPDYTLGQQAVRALSDVLHTKGGAIWRISQSDTLVPVSQYETTWNIPLTQQTCRALMAFYTNHDWIIDLEAVPKEAERALDQCRDIVELKNSRFLIPLFVEHRLFGIVLLDASTLPIELIWEDYDLLKLIANQAASTLALQRAYRLMSETEQLTAYTRLSAFVVHDLKTVTAQLSLISDNANRHQNNPDFIVDLLSTISNSVAKLQRLLSQLKGESTESDEGMRIDLVRLVDAALSEFAGQQPTPVRKSSNERVMVNADPASLQTAIGHLLQNAIDACTCNDRITVSIDMGAYWVELNIEDTGSGMQPEYLKDRLFRPFESTKGLTGMGIGVYQAREYLRSIGGEMTADSEINQGTCFTMRFPILLQAGTQT